MPQPHKTVSIDEVKDCLQRSGYLIGSRLVRTLSDAQFFVEPNVAYKNVRTGKAHEVSLTAEDASGYTHPGVCVKTTFVIDAVNNLYPVVLLTERPSSPNADFESYIKFASTPEQCPFMDQFDIYGEKHADTKNLFSQYCALAPSTSTDELVASHPEELAASLMKVAEYTHSEIVRFEEWSSEQQEEYWRLFIWQPMIVVSGQLMVAKTDSNGSVQIHEVPLARLEFNWHDGEERRTTVIEVIREDFLLERVEAVRTKDAEIEERMFTCRSQLS